MYLWDDDDDDDDDDASVRLGAAFVSERPNQCASRTLKRVGNETWRAQGGGGAGKDDSSRTPQVMYEISECYNKNNNNTQAQTKTKA